MAKVMGVPTLGPVQLTSGPEASAVTAGGFDQTTPLWYYVLKEAEVTGAGQHLGPLGSRIVAEVFYGLMHSDPNSFLRQQSDWKPTLPAAKPGTFTMADLLHFVNDIDPIG